MSITTTCPQCKSLFHLPEDLAGKQVRCQKCESMFVVPAMVEEVVEAVEPPLATPVLADEVIEATVAPEDEIVMATLAETKPPPVPRPAERPSSAVGGLALVVLFLTGLMGAGTFATIWIATHLGPRLHASAALPVNAGVKDKVMKQDWEIKPEVKKARIGKEKEQVIPSPLFPGPDGRAFANGRTEQVAWLDHGKWKQHGPYQLYRISLKEGITYNFHLSGGGVEPMLRIFDGDFEVATSPRAPEARVMLAYRPNRTGDHLLWVTTQGIAANFDMRVAPESRQPPVQVNLAAQPNYTDFAGLRLEDPLDPAKNTFGPYREYMVALEQDKEYTFSVNNPAFRPVLQIDNGNFEHSNPNTGRLDIPFRAQASAKYRVRVTSEQFALGNYTLRVTLKTPTVPQPQNILAALDAQGNFEERRSLAASDVNVVGRGRTKAYFLNLEKGQRYRIQMSLGDALTSLTLFDPAGKEVASTSREKDASVVHTASETGGYRIHVAASLPINGEREYTVRVTTLP